MTTREQDVRLADGRVLRILDTGPADGHAVLVCHGTPASRRLHDRWVTAAADAGLRLISYDRPGYGSSSPRPGRTIADTAADVAAIADDLGLDRFAVWGPSAGGPHALACAALLADRVVAAVLASYAPYNAPGLDFFAGMSEGAPNFSSWRPPAGMRCSRCCRRRPKRSERMRPSSGSSR